MLTPLSEVENRELLGILISYFNFNELQELAFFLDIDAEEVPWATKSQFARELILYCQRRGELSCLVEEIARLRPNVNLGHFLQKLSFCQQNIKIQLIYHGGEIRIEIVEKLFFKFIEFLGYSKDEVRFIGKAYGSILMLVSLPEQAISRVMNAISVANDMEFSITLFEDLEIESQAAWKHIYNLTQKLASVEPQLISQSYPIFAWESIVNLCSEQIESSPINQELEHLLSTRLSRPQLETIRNILGISSENAQNDSNEKAVSDIQNYASQKDMITQILEVAHEVMQADAISSSRKTALETQERSEPTTFSETQERSKPKLSSDPNEYDFVSSNEYGDIFVRSSAISGQRSFRSLEKGDSDLAEILRTNFSLSELKSLSNKLGIMFERLPGDTQDQKIYEMVVELRTENRIEQLIEKGRELKPLADWPRLGGSQMPVRA